MPAATKAIVRYRNRPTKVKHHTRAKMTIPLAVIGGFVPLATFAWEGYQVGGSSNAGARIAQRLTGIDSTTHQFIVKELVMGWGPIIAGILMHKVANKLGVNAALGRAGVPLLRL